MQREIPRVRSHAISASLSLSTWSRTCVHSCFQPEKVQNRSTCAILYSVCPGDIDICPPLRPSSMLHPISCPVKSQMEKGQLPFISERSSEVRESTLSDRNSIRPDRPTDRPFGFLSLLSGHFLRPNLRPRETQKVADTCRKFVTYFIATFIPTRR